MAGESLLEREAALMTIDHALSSAHDGQGTAAFIVGEAGLGKTSLLDRSRTLAAGRFDVAVGRGDAAEATLPFGILSQALAHLRGSSVASPPTLEAAAADARGAYFYSALTTLQRHNQPVLIVLDDLHWADPDSQAVVAFLCRRVSDLPVVVIGALRPWPTAALELINRLVAQGHAEVVHLQPLTLGAADSLLKNRLGAGISSGQAARAWELCSGNPFLLEQAAIVLKASPDRGLEGLRNGHAQLLLSRFAGVSPTAVAYAQTAAIFGNRFRPGLVREIAGLTMAEADRALDALSRTGLIRGSDGWAEFVHPLFRQVLYEDVPLAVRSLRHVAAFRALRANRVDPAEAAEHARHAHLQGDSDAIEVLYEAGRRALTSGAFARARELLQAAVDQAGAQRVDSLLLALGDAILGLGDLRAANSTYRRVLALPGLSPRARVTARWKLARALALSLAVSEASSEFEAAIDDAVAHDPAQAVQIMLDQAWGTWLNTGTEAPLRLASRARALAQTMDPLIRRRADAAWAFCAFHAGDPSGIDMLRDAARLASSDPLAELSDLAWSWGTLGCYLGVAKFSEYFDEAEQVFRTAITAAESAGMPAPLVMFEVAHGDTYLRLGRLSDALALVEGRLAFAEMVPFAMFWCAIGMAAITYEMGRSGESQHWARQAESGGAPLRGILPIFWMWLWHIQARHERDSGHIAEAAARYQELDDLAMRSHIGKPCVVPWAGDAIEVFLASDRVDDAKRVLAGLEQVAAQLPCRWPRVIIATSKAALEERAGDRAAAESHFQEALALHAAMEMPLAEMETLIQYGGFLRRGRELRLARAVLAQALGAAERIGAARLAGHAHAELSAAGGRRHQRAPLDGLTAQEARVADLARDGLTDKEIARQLRISTKTVEAHLQHIYRKVGVRSRRELMRRPSQPLAG